MTLTIKKNKKVKVFSENPEISTDGNKYLISEQQKFYEIYKKYGNYEVDFVLPTDGATS